MMLQRSQSEILRKLLIDLGVAVVGSYATNGTYNGQPWPAFFTTEPSIPDNCITVQDTVGNIDARDMFGTIHEHLGFQVRVRSLGHNVGQARINAIRTAMAEQVSQLTVPIDAERYLVQCIAQISAVMYIGLDVPNSRRSIFTFNGTVAVRQLV